MKRIVSVFLICVLLISFASCGIDNISDVVQDTNSDEISVNVLSKNNLSKNINEGRFSDRVEFSFEINNLTSMPIKGIQGDLVVYDMFGDKIITIGCDFTGKIIPANDSIFVSDIVIDINPYMDDHIKLYNEKYEDLKFEYDVSEIVYSDDDQAVIEEDVNNGTYSDINVEVINKYNLNEDHSVGRYSPRVEFAFKITNKGIKSIKGIQGTLVVNDLFGESIITIDCDFTGEIINPNSDITVYDLGIDINEFMDNHLKLFNEKYDDLNFEYKIKNVVYTDNSSGIAKSNKVGIRTITFSDKNTAEYVYGLWNQGEATEETMISLMNEYGSEQGGGQLYVVEKGYFVSDIDEWCFDEDRTIGDTAVIENDYGYSICYFSSFEQ